MQLVDTVDVDTQRRSSVPINVKQPQSNEMGKPVGREYLLRTTASLPTVNSRNLPQRLFAVLQRNSFRMSGAFSEDTTFY